MAELGRNSEDVAVPTAGPTQRARPEQTQNLSIWLCVTTDDVFIRVTDRRSPGGDPAEFWRRRFDRPAGKTERECVGAALHALWSGREQWLDLLGRGSEPPLPVEW